MPSEQFIKFRKILDQNRSPDGEIKVASMRRNMDRVGGRFPEAVTGTASTVGGVTGEWIAADHATDDSVVLYLHGGGYVAGSVDSHRNLIGHLAQHVPCRIFAANYRLAPEHPHPAPVDDAVAIYRALLRDLGIDPGRVAIVGDSAGGGLTVATLVALRDGGDPLPATAVTISPWIDLEATGESAETRAEADPLVSAESLRRIGRLFLGDSGHPQDPLAAPLHAELAGLPPMLIQVGDAEVLLDDANRLADLLHQSGVDVTLEVWPDMVHVWHGAAGFVPEADQALARVGEFIGPFLALDG